MKELINTLFDSSKERIKNPFIGAFVFSWIAFNWKAVFILLFSSLSVLERIDEITQNYSSIAFTLWLPLGFAIIYVGILPYIMWLFDWISKRSWRGRKQNLVEQQIFEIRSKQRIAEEESALENIRASYRDKADLNKKIEVLTTQLNERDETNEMLEKELKSLKEDRFQLQEIIKQQTQEALTEAEKEEFELEYKKFRESDLYDFFRELGASISRRNGVPSSMNDLVVEKYRHSGIIKEVEDNESQRMYTVFTKKGEYFWKRYVMSVRITKRKEEHDDLPF